MDKLLDEARLGPTFLKQTAIAELIQASISFGSDAGHYDIHSWVIMANHVHLLITPRIGLSQLLCSLKTATATRANRLLHRTGQPFWQDESYDHLARGEDEFRTIQRYIENNPVKACLVSSPEDYIWSSAWRPERAPPAEGLPHNP